MAWAGRSDLRSPIGRMPGGDAWRGPGGKGVCLPQPSTQTIAGRDDSRDERCASASCATRMAWRILQRAPESALADRLLALPDARAALTSRRSPTVLAREISARAADLDRRLPACCLFTSGSTGAPKGGPIAGEDLDRRAEAEVDCYGISAADRLLNGDCLLHSTLVSTRHSPASSPARSWCCSNPGCPKTCLAQSRDSVSPASPACQPSGETSADPGFASTSRVPARLRGMSRYPAAA